MTDTSNDILQPPSPNGVPQALLPPDVSAISQAFSQVPENPDQSGQVSAKQRLIGGAKIRREQAVSSGMAALPEPSPAPVSAVQDPASMTDELAPTLKGDRQVNLQARLAQLFEAADPNSMASALRTAAARADKSPDLEPFQRMLKGDPLDDVEFQALRENLPKITEELDQFEGDGKFGEGEVLSVKAYPDGIWTKLAFDPTGEPNDLPATLTGDPGDSLPAHALKEATEGFNVLAGNSSVIYSAPVDDTNDRLLRAMFPGPKGLDGQPRWLKVRPLPITDHSAVERAIITFPGSEMESYADPDAYPGTMPGEWIVFDAPENDRKAWRPPPWTGTQLQKLNGGVARSAPDVQLVELGDDELAEPKLVQQRLADTAWAVTRERQDEGSRPVTDQDGNEWWLTFGVEPSAVESADVYWTNKGYIGDPDEVPDPPQFALQTPAGVAEFEPDEYPARAALPRTTRRATRMAYKVDPNDSGRIADLATSLERSGAKNVAVYAAQSEIEGFEAARERLYNDGVSTRVLRTADSKLGDPNAVPLFVRSARHLPSDPGSVDPGAIVTPPIEPEGGKFVVDGSGDLAEVAWMASALAAKYGAENVVLRNTDEGGEIQELSLFGG